jgi:hypothetical protein
MSDFHEIFDPAAVASSRSSRSKQSSASSSKRSSSPLKNMAALRDAGISYDEISHNITSLGAAGKKLYQDLDSISSMIEAFPAQVCNEISETMDHSIVIHDFYKNMHDSRSRQELLHELSEIKTINQLSRRCNRDMEGEAEWNNAVHSVVLRMVFGPDDPMVGWRYMYVF